MTPAAIDARIVGLRKFFAAHVPLTVYPEVCTRVEAEIAALTAGEEVLRLLEVYCEKHAGEALEAAKAQPKGTYNRALRLGLANGYIGVKKLLYQPDRLRILALECGEKLPPVAPGIVRSEGFDGQPEVLAAMLAPKPTLADLTLLVDDLAARAKAFGIVYSDHSASGQAEDEAARAVTDARTALLAAIGMLTGGEP